MREDLTLIKKHFKELYKNVQNPKNTPIEDLVKERRGIVERYGFVNGIEPPISEEAKITKLTIGNISAEWLMAPDSDPNKRLLYLHGGAFIAGSINSHRLLAYELAKRAKIAVLIIDYRLAPENPFPAGLDDCFEAYNWLLENSLEKKEPAHKIYVAGDSAGGNLSIALALKLKKEKKQLPNAISSVSPVLDLFGRGESVKKLDGIDPVLNRKGLVFGLPMVYLFGKDVLNMKDNKLKVMTKILVSKNKKIRNPLVSPLYADLSGLPPIFINTGENEILRDDSTRFYKKAKEKGVNIKLKIWPEMMHVFIAFLGYLPEADKCLDEIADFLINEGVN
ncbi:MAG: alpha/beta hydrolase [Candidatus Sericytochromatia bacterium]